MFPSLNESIGWSRGIESILPSSTIILGDSQPLDTLPFIYNFMNFWLKPQSTATPTTITTTTTTTSTTSTTSTAIVFISFKSSQNRIVGVFRKLFGIQLNLLAAQSRFAFIDAVNDNDNQDQILKDLESTLKRFDKCRTLVILEGFSWIIAPGIGSSSKFITTFTKIRSLITKTNSNLLVQWSRDLEDDYPGRNPLLIQDIRFGGAGWLHLLNNSHYVFCVRPLKSGMTRDATGEIVVALGPLMQNVEIKPIFHPILTLYKIPADDLIQSFTKGNI